MKVAEFSPRISTALVIGCEDACVAACPEHACVVHRRLGERNERVILIRIRDDRLQYGETSDVCSRLGTGHIQYHALVPE